jgi:glycosyltransferase involved in cell wall biosynthesis
MEPIRVLCVFAKLNRGGAESMCMNLYRAIDRDKIQFDFVKHTGEECDFEDEIRSLGGKIYQAPRFCLYNYNKYCSWWKSHFKNHPEHSIIHGHYFTISPIYFKVAKKFNRVTVAHSHSTAPKVKNIKTRLRSLILTKIKTYADYYLSCSSEAGLWLYGSDGVQTSKYYMIRNAVDTDKYCFNEKFRTHIRKEFDVESNCILIGTIGRMTEAKNPVGFVEICKHIELEYEKQNQSVKFIWVGTGPMKNVVVNEIEKRNLENKFILPGVRSDINHILMAMDAFILPSLWEGLPVVVVEAQASGIPCFISDRITRDVEITQLVHYLSIDNNLEYWGKAVCAEKLIRQDVREKIVTSGFDIKAAAKRMEELYLSM